VGKFRFSETMVFIDAPCVRQSEKDAPNSSGIKLDGKDISTADVEASFEGNIEVTDETNEEYNRQCRQKVSTSTYFILLHQKLRICTTLGSAVSDQLDVRFHRVGLRPTFGLRLTASNCKCFTERGCTPLGEVLQPAVSHVSMQMYVFLNISQFFVHQGHKFWFCFNPPLTLDHTRSKTTLVKVTTTQNTNMFEPI
jgi:hypothetical protein